MNSEEHVLVIPTSTFEAVGHFNGFNPNARPYMDAIYHPGTTEFRPRITVETDLRFKQVIPYAIFERTRPDGVIELFNYRRGGGQGERRLHGQSSIGVGGHINSEDDTADPFATGLRREVDEEVRLLDSFGKSEGLKMPNPQEVGLINDESTPVNQVHLGVVLLYRLGPLTVEAKESTMHSSGFNTIAELYKVMSSLELWSQLCLRTLYPATEHFKPEDFVGMPHAEATSLAAGAGCTCRITRQDGRENPMTMEFVPTRINFEVEAGKIVRVSRG